MTENKALARQESREASVLANYSQEQLDILRDQIAPGATEMELRYFLEVAKRRGLDPFAKQIYAIRRKIWNAERRVEEDRMTIQTGIDGLRAIADRTGAYAPGDESWAGAGDDLAATVSVRKRVGGEWITFSATAHVVEYMPLRRDGAPQGLWARMPRVMIAKVAEAKALRKGWPEQIGGLYTADEMEQADAHAPALDLPSKGGAHANTRAALERITAAAAKTAEPRQSVTAAETITITTEKPLGPSDGEAREAERVIAEKALDVHADMMRPPIPDSREERLAALRGLCKSLGARRAEKVLGVKLKDVGKLDSAMLPQLIEMATDVIAMDLFPVRDPGQEG